MNPVYPVAYFQTAFPLDATVASGYYIYFTCTLTGNTNPKKFRLLNATGSNDFMYHSWRFSITIFLGAFQKLLFERARIGLQTRFSFHSSKTKSLYKKKEDGWEGDAL